MGCFITMKNGMEWLWRGSRVPHVSVLSWFSPSCFKVFLQLDMIAFSYLLDTLKMPEIFILLLCFWDINLIISIELRCIDFPTYHLSDRKAEFIIIITLGGSIWWYFLGTEPARNAVIFCPTQTQGQCPVLDPHSVLCVWITLSPHLFLRFRDCRFTKSLFLPAVNIQFKKVGSEEDQEIVTQIH